MIHNTHERQLSAPAEGVGQLIDSLSGPGDQLWPRRHWPPLRLDQPLGAGARGGHGPVRYSVESYTPGQHVRFRFEAPTGFDGYHEYIIVPDADGSTTLRHTLIMRVTVVARLSWPLFYRPLHDALIEDSLDQAARSLGIELPAQSRWGKRVQFLRWLARRATATLTTQNR